MGRTHWQFKIKTWFWWCVPLGFLFAVLQRPLRDAGFVNGFLTAWYWALWLCYAEGQITTTNGPPSGAEFIGFFVGFISNVVALLAVVIGTIWWNHRNDD